MNESSTGNKNNEMNENNHNKMPDLNESAIELNSRPVKQPVNVSK